jgi:hypothetical protein
MAAEPTSGPQDSQEDLEVTYNKQEFEDMSLANDVEPEKELEQ